jgi:hypothetical protein
MLKDATIIELMGSIGQTGYFAGEPMLVAKTPTEGVYEVVEGNRRLTAVKLLNDPTLAPIKKKTVEAAAEMTVHRETELPVVIYEHRDEVLSYLGYRHITGIKEWDPLEKARYLHQLYEASGDLPEEEKYRAAARTIGSRADYVARLLTGLRVYERIEEKDFFGLPGVGPESISFSVLTTALTYNGISRFIGLSERGDTDISNLVEERLRDVTSWMFEKVSEGRTRLGESRRLSELSRVVVHDTALKAFESGMPLVDAARLTDQPSVVYRGAVNTARERLKEARENAHRVEDATAGDLEQLTEIALIARGLRATLQEQIEAAQFA